MTIKKTNRITSAAELVNDPSLRWCAYRQFELVWSDSHKTEMRFNGYNPDGTVNLANMAMGPVPGNVGALSIRRPTAGDAGQGYYDVSKPNRGK